MFPNLVPPTRKVLLVEDNPLNQKIQTLMLQTLGCAVDLAPDAEQALAMPLDDYDVIFMDVGLPGQSGIDATKQIRARGGFHATLPIIAMTAHMIERDCGMALKAGMDKVLIKPVVLKQLNEILEAL